MCLVASVLGPGCGLVSSDVADVAIQLPDKMFSVDTTSWQIASGQASSYLAMSCANAASVCDSAAQLACANGCTGECDALTHTCDLRLDVSLYQEVDVGKEQPNVAKVGASTQVQITIDAVTYSVTTNTLDVDTPPLTVYIAPVSVTAPGPMAKVIGTIAPVPAGQTLTTNDLEFSATGQADLSAAMSSYATPFNVIIGGSLALHGGDPPPTGKLDARLHVRAHAGL